jgi:hypothetical protein
MIEKQLESCEFGEDIAISTYKNALKDNLEYSNAKAAFTK